MAAGSSWIFSASAMAAASLAKIVTSPSSCRSTRPGASSATAHRYLPAAGNVPSTRNIPGREGSVPASTVGAPPPVGVNSTRGRPAVNAEKSLSRVKCTAKRRVPPATSTGYSMNSSVVSVQLVTSSVGSSSTAGPGWLLPQANESSVQSVRTRAGGRRITESPSRWRTPARFRRDAWPGRDRSDASGRRGPFDRRRATAGCRARRRRS